MVALLKGHRQCIFTVMSVNVYGFAPKTQIIIVNNYQEY